MSQYTQYTQDTQDTQDSIAQCAIYFIYNNNTKHCSACSTTSCSHSHNHPSRHTTSNSNVSPHQLLQFDIALTYFKQRSSIQCHFCDFSASEPLSAFALNHHLFLNHQLSYELELGSNTFVMVRDTPTANLTCPVPTCQGWNTNCWDDFTVHVTSNHNPSSNDSSHGMCRH
jgi:hypothetical protein